MEIAKSLREDPGIIYPTFHYFKVKKMAVGTKWDLFTIAVVK